MGRRRRLFDRASKISLAYLCLISRDPEITHIQGVAADGAREEKKKSEVEHKSKSGMGRGGNL